MSSCRRRTLPRRPPVKIVNFDDLGAPALCTRRRAAARNPPGALAMDSAAPNALMRTRPRGPADARAGAGVDVLVVAEDVVGVVRGLHVHQPVVDRVAIRLADPVGVFVAAEEVDVDAFAEAPEGGEEPPRPGGVPVAEVLAGPPYTIEGY